MALSGYLAIYGMAEALVLSLIVNIVIGAFWWRLRQARRLQDEACRAIGQMLAQEMEVAADDPELAPELRANRLATLNALLIPFQTHQVGNIKLWKSLLSSLRKNFDELAAKVMDSDPPEALPDVELESQKDPLLDTLPAQLEAETDTLLARCDASLPVLAAHHATTVEIQRKCDEMKQAHHNLRVHLDSVLKLEGQEGLETMLVELEQSNFELNQMLFNLEHSHGNLKPQMQAMSEQIAILQTSIRNYRISTQKLMVERDSLVETRKKLLHQLETKTKVCERLTHNYDALRREYTKLYESTH